MNADDFLTTELKTHLEEFKAARETMLFDVGASRQVINITHTAAGIFVAATPFIIQSELPILFLIIPIIFYPLAWSQIRNLYLSDVLSEYLLKMLIPQIRKVLGELSPDKDRDLSQVLGMEAYFGAADRRNRLVLFPIAAGNYGINLLAILFSLSAYFVLLNQLSRHTLTVELLLIIANGLLLLYTVFLGFWVRFITDTSKLAETILVKGNEIKH